MVAQMPEHAGNQLGRCPVKSVTVMPVWTGGVPGSEALRGNRSLASLRVGGSPLRGAGGKPGRNRYPTRPPNRSAPRLYLGTKQLQEVGRGENGDSPDLSRRLDVLLVTADNAVGFAGHGALSEQSVVWI